MGDGREWASTRTRFLFALAARPELRLEVSRELVQSQVCRTQEDLIAYRESWRSALEARGWVK